MRRLHNKLLELYGSLAMKQKKVKDALKLIVSEYKFIFGETVGDLQNWRFNDTLLDSNSKLNSLKVAGGACANNYLMQFQADMLGVPVERPSVIETTALGAAYLAGLAVGYWKQNDITQNWQLDRAFAATMEDDKKEKLYKGWKKAVGRAMQWEE